MLDKVTGGIAMIVMGPAMNPRYDEIPRYLFITCCDWVRFPVAGHLSIVLYSLY